MTLDDAVAKCASLEDCSHFSIDLAGARSMLGDTQQLVFWFVVNMRCKLPMYPTLCAALVDQ